jgi:hypothetical protein
VTALRLIAIIARFVKLLGENLRLNHFSGHKEVIRRQLFYLNELYHTPGFYTHLFEIIKIYFS